MAAFDFFAAIDGLWSLKDRIAARLSGTQREKQAALRAISVALDETYFYYERRRAGEPRDRNSEQRLARYWSAAAISVRAIDRNLALVLDRKSEYWVRPDGWTDQEVVRAGIRLEKVRQRYRSMLKNDGVKLKGRRLRSVAPARPRTRKT